MNILHMHQVVQVRVSVMKQHNQEQLKKFFSQGGCFDMQLSSSVQHSRSSAPVWRKAQAMTAQAIGHEYS